MSDHVEKGSGISTVAMAMTASASRLQSRTSSPSCARIEILMIKLKMSPMHQAVRVMLAC